MFNLGCKNIRNIGIIAHVDAGKTTLTERILFETGNIRFPGEVHEGTTSSDFSQQERERGISIQSAALTCHWNDFRINIVDTPGHVDFTAEVERTLRVMDGAVAVFCAVHGVQAQSETVWRRARRYSLPVVAYINKMDREGADFDSVLNKIRDRFALPALALQLPLYRDGNFVGAADVIEKKVVFVLEDYGSSLELSVSEQLDLELAHEHLLECLAESDDEVLRCYLNNEAVLAKELIAALRRTVCAGVLIPVFCGSARQTGGVKALLDAVCQYLPSPRVKKAQVDLVISSDELASSSSAACCLVFNVSRESWQGSWIAVRLYSGSISSGSKLKNIRTSELVTVKRVLRLQAAETCEINHAAAGDIVALDIGEADCKTADTLCSEGFISVLEEMSFPEPVVLITFIASTDEHRDLLAQALEKSAVEDPSLRVTANPEGGWTVAGMGAFHLEVLQERIKIQHGNIFSCGIPQVKYKNSILKCAELRKDFVKQLTSEKSLKAGIKISVSPLNKGKGLILDTEILQKELPESYCDAVKQAIDEVVESGVPGGHPLTDIRILVQEVYFDADETSELAFLTVTKLAMEEILDLAVLVELEPVMRLEVSTPQDHVGNVIADLTARQGRVIELDSLALGESRIEALVPLSEMFGYANALRTLSSGRAEFTVEPSSYEVRHESAKLNQ